MAESKQATFLTLSRELRVKVYDEFLVTQVPDCGMWEGLECEYGELEGVESLCKAIPDYRNEILPRFFVALRSNTIYFTSEKNARVFMMDKFWSPAEFGQAMKGSIAISNPPVTKAILDIMNLYQKVGAAALKDGYWCDGQGNPMIRDRLRLLGTDVAAGRTIATATCHSPPDDDKKCRIQGTGWELNIHLGLNFVNLQWDGEVEGDIWRLGFLHSEN